MPTACQARQRPFSTAGALRGNLAFGGHISTRTVIRRPIKRLQLTLRHRHARFDWSHDHSSCTERPLPRPSGYEPVLSRRRFARSTCTWTVSNIPRLTKTLHQSYNDGMVNPTHIYLSVKQVIDRFLFRCI
jgi:hypothetical protein